jgi:beta-phosphoglucomutase-like phosphatase (HAD superfamily)
MIRAVIFDFNGVLIDDEQIHFELFREVLAQEGVA